MRGLRKIASVALTAVCCFSEVILCRCGGGPLRRPLIHFQRNQHSSALPTLRTVYS
jgi:hypothetical protein